MNRRKSRETAFILVFEWSFQGGDMQSVIDRAVTFRELEVDEFATTLALRTVQHCDEIDALIQRYSQKWKLSRLGKVTLACLRLAFCELTAMEDIPLGATINEAVELAKRYSTEDEASYVNGVLGQFGRDRAGAKANGKPQGEPDVEPVAEVKAAPQDDPEAAPEPVPEEAP